jgi:predicted DCC family thiol-disulfide oxidoreductase YuxK
MTQDPKAADEVFFDGACPLCRREVATYQRIDGLAEATWTDVTAPEASLSGLSREEALARFHVRTRAGEVVSGFAAFLAIWRRNRRARGIAIVLDRQPFLWLGESAYRGFLRIRPLWRKA